MKIENSMFDFHGKSGAGGQCCSFMSCGRASILCPARQRMRPCLLSHRRGAGPVDFRGRSPPITAVIHALLDRYSSSGPVLTIVLMTTVAIGDSPLGMSEELIPLVPIFLLRAAHVYIVICCAVIFTIIHSA